PPGAAARGSPRSSASRSEPRRVSGVLRWGPRSFAMLRAYAERAGRPGTVVAFIATAIPWLLSRRRRSRGWSRRGPRRSPPLPRISTRSEERRVGKEGRCGWAREREREQDENDEEKEWWDEKGLRWTKDGRGVAGE